MIGNFEEQILDNMLYDEKGELCLFRLFDFNYPLHEDHKPRLERLFFYRYRFYEINFDSFPMFKDMLMSKLHELSPKYNKLYATEDAIINPFLNVIMQNNNWIRERGRQKNYSEAFAKSARYDYMSNAEIDVSRGGVIAKSSNALENTVEAVNKTKGLEDNKENNLNRYTDTPQKKDVEYIDNIGDVQTHIFNDGYLTTVARDNNQSVKVNSKTDDNYQKTGEQSSSDNIQSTLNYKDNVTEGETDSNIKSYNDFYGVNAIENTQKNLNSNYGLNNLSVSKALAEYRQSVIQIDTLFLDDLRSLFMYIF